MKMNREELDTIVEQMVELLGVEETLVELTKAMSSDELQENLEYIDNMQELHLF